MIDFAATSVFTKSEFKVDSIKRYLSSPTSVGAATALKVELATIELSSVPADPINGSLSLYGIPAADATQFAVGSSYHLYLVKA